MLLAAVALPSLHAARDRDAAVMAARHLGVQLNHVRAEAIRRNRMVAMRFDPEDPGRTAIYVDQDGDGVLESDIADGTDLQIEAETHLSEKFAGVAFGVPIDVPAPDGVGVIPGGSDPVRIGNSNLLSFGPLGTATSGTLYLAGRGGSQVCVRVLGVTGRVRVLVYQRARGQWQLE